VLGDPLGVDAAERVGQFGGVDEADGHGLAVAQVVPADRLEGVGQGVAVVEDGPAATLVLVRGDDVGLDAHARGDLLVERQRVEVAAAEEVVLRELALAAAQLARGHGGEHLGVAQHSRGLPERADEVLAPGRFRGLPPIAASIWPRRVVETYTTLMPRWYTDAVNPPTSVTRPPHRHDRVAGSCPTR
jgi:hypothetical protein